jgi:hypothetical protein
MRSAWHVFNNNCGVPQARRARQASLFQNLTDADQGVATRQLAQTVTPGRGRIPHGGVPNDDGVARWRTMPLAKHTAPRRRGGEV